MDVEGLPMLGSMVRFAVVSNAVERALHSVHVLVTINTPKCYFVVLVARMNSKCM